MSTGTSLGPRIGVGLVALLGLCARPIDSGAKPWRVLVSDHAAPLEDFAAREIRRYAYLRTGELLSLDHALVTLPGDANLVLVAQKSRPILANLATNAELRGVFGSLGPQQYLLKTIDGRGQRIVLVCGGDEVATLYGAYRLAEHLGARFYLHGDVIPDERIALEFPKLDELAKPLFALRGIQPFHDFPEGPDWWNRDDYLAILSQLPKLRMNFFGLHTYPENRPNAEPTVWIGLTQDFGPQGEVTRSYPSSYQNTLRGNWGYAPKKTADYSCGGGLLFETDPFGPDVMSGMLPEPATPDDCNLVFNRTAALLREAFTQARRLGIKTCVGTETPLVVPKLVVARLKELGRDPGNPAVARELYEGLFRRIAAAHPLDYYWFWTPEGWTWEGTKPEQIAATTNDLFAAIAAWREVKLPFALATCGWVLGPQQDRSMFDKVLPKTMAVSCINRQVGQTPVERGFADVHDRGKWAIPWMEDDPALTSPQLWVGRMRRDAADARRYGCDGLMGIHWRTRVLGPAVSALANAAWDQSPWIDSYPPQSVPPPELGIAEGGQFARFPDHTIAGTEDDALYQSVRYNVRAYRLPVPNGSYKVTLMFCEPHYDAPGKRVFDVRLQGQSVIEHLDIFANVGQDRALDYVFNDVAATNGRLTIEFGPVTEYPSIAALAVEGIGFTRKINCGGDAFRDYEADPPAEKEPPQVYAATKDFYEDWALAHFGREVAGATAEVFEKIDCRLPRPSDWVHGPGGIRPDPRPWAKVSPEYAFVDELAALRPRVRGTGNQERFDWWLNTFRHLRAMARVNCTWALCTNALGQVKAEATPEAQRQLARQELLPLRRQLVREVTELYATLLATVSNPGEMGTVMNWEQHNFPDLIEKPGAELAKLLDESLPDEASLPKEYRGPTRIIVPTLRTAFSPGEPVRLKVIVLSEAKPREVRLHTRNLGRGRFAATPVPHVARGVYSAALPTAGDDDLEYYVSVVDANGAEVVFPATAPALSQTLVRMTISLSSQP